MAEQPQPAPAMAVAAPSPNGGGVTPAGGFVQLLTPNGVPAPIPTQLTPENACPSTGNTAAHHYIYCKPCEVCENTSLFELWCFCCCFVGWLCGPCLDPTSTRALRCERCGHKVKHTDPQYKTIQPQVRTVF